MPANDFCDIENQTKFVSPADHGGINVGFVAETLFPSHFTLPVVVATVALTTTRERTSTRERRGKNFEAAVMCPLADSVSASSN